MQYLSTYMSPLGEMLIAAEDNGLVGLWFQGAKHYAAGLNAHCEHKETALITQTKMWLDEYFAGREPTFTPQLAPHGTPFQMEVWELLRNVPYGKTTTYGEIANAIAKRHGAPRMSAQAVGGAVGSNKISLIIPCHRVVGANNSLVGYAAGTDKKAYLLQMEKVGKI